MSTSLENLVAQMSVAELAQRSGRSVSQLVELAFGSGAASTATGAKRGPGRPPGPSKGKGKGKGKKSKAAAAAPAKAAPAKATPAKAQPAAPKAASAGKPAPAAKKGGNVDTRAAAGRAKYDETVLGAIKSSKGKVKAADLRKKLGGTPLQIRAALHRLIESAKIKAQGQARGTTYVAA